MLVKKPGVPRAYLGISLLVLLGVAAVSTGLFRPAKGYRAAFLELISPGVIPPPAGVELLDDVIRRKEDFAVNYYGFVYRGNTGNYIDANVYYYGAYEKPELCLLRETLASIGPDAVVIDVGASTGLYSLFASKYAKEVHAVEPFPPALERLRAAIAENKISNIIVHPVGLGQTEEKLGFFSPSERNLGAGTFVDGFTKNKRDEHLKLQIVPGDVYFRQAGIQRIDLIKMDIEGFEKPALAGLHRILERHRPIVLLEVNVRPDLPQLFKSLEELKATFPENYEFFEMADRNNFIGAYRLRPLQRPFDEDQFYVLATPNEKAKIVPMMFDGRSVRKR